ncbi:YceH family protein [Thermodesulfobacteriota bacterium]
MDIILNEIEVRVLGSLMEKSMTTPEYYPLSLSALTNACNQKSSREPVVSYDQKTVVRALDSLKEKQLIVQSDGGRVPKYSEIFTARRNLVDREGAVLMVLFLRGPQTVGEIRGRTERAYPFSELTEVETTLDELSEAGYVRQLPRLPGRKEPRYAHLFAGEPEIDEERIAQPEPAAIEVMAENERIASLEEEVGGLRKDLETLRADFEIFRKEFE